MTCTVSVTFEFDQRASQTYRGTVTAGRAWTVMHRAVQQAQKALKPVGWSSCVCVLLDRTESGDVDDAVANLSDGQDAV